VDSKIAERFEILLHEEIDWTYLIRIAGAHGMLPLVYWNLNAACPDAIATANLAQLRDHFCANAARNLFLADELLHLLDLLAANAIPALPFKGLVLAAAAYGNLALREFWDLDVLVSERDFLRAKDLFLVEGYRFLTPLTATQVTNWSRTQNAFSLVRGDDEVHVDLHCRITPRYLRHSLDLAYLKERLETVSLLGATVPSLPPEDLLVVLCIHGGKHAWTRLDWICGVAELIRRHPCMDWGKVFDQADRLHGRRMLALGLLLASNLLELSLPQEVMNRVQADFKAQTLAKRVRARLFQETDSQSAPEVVAAFLLRLQTLERLQDRMRYALHVLATPILATPSARDAAFFRLPPRLSYLYYLIRPIRLMRQYGLSLLRHLRT